jgi:hypothetical protein
VAKKLTERPPANRPPFAKGVATLGHPPRLVLKLGGWGDSDSLNT